VFGVVALHATLAQKLNVTMFEKIVLLPLKILPPLTFAYSYLHLLDYEVI
jgi:hypothetical protein